MEGLTLARPLSSATTTRSAITTMPPKTLSELPPDLRVLELRHVPIQDRSVRQVRNILQAARTLLAEVGRDRLTTAPVALAAGVSIGTVYRYFPDRVALLDAIAPNPERQVAEIAAVMYDETLDSADAINKIVEIVDVLNEEVVRNARARAASE